MTEYVEQKVREELLNDGDLLISTVYAINSENGILEDLYVLHMSELDEALQGKEPSEILTMAKKGCFNICDDYFYYNGDKLKSFSKTSFIKECESFYFDEIVEQIDNIRFASLPVKLKSIIQDAEFEESELEEIEE